MSEKAKVKYNEFTFGEPRAPAESVFGVATAFPIPLVGLDTEYVQAGERWVLLNRITLTGEILECSKAAFVTRQNELIKAFAQDFKTLEISGLNSKLAKNSETGIVLAKVISVTFDDSDYLSSVGYSIVLEAYDFEEFKEFLGTNYVVDPVDSIKMQENDDKTLSVTHTISAKGVNGGGYNGLTNAKNFVTQLLSEYGEAPGALNTVSAPRWQKPALIYAIPPRIEIDVGGNVTESDPDFKRLLVSVSEDIDRITNTYALTKVYKSDLYAAQGHIILRQTKETREQEGQFKIFTIQGSVDGGIGEELDFQEVRDRFTLFKKSLDTDFVNELIGSLSISEDIQAGRLEFSVTYTSNKFEVNDDYDITISETSETAIVSVSVAGKLSAKGPIGLIGAEDCRYNLVLSSFDEDKYYVLAVKEYNDYVERRKELTIPNRVILNKKHLASNVTYNEFEGSISYSFEFSDRLSHGYRTFDYTLNFSPSLQGIAVDPLVDGGHAFYDLGFRTRAAFKVNGSTLGVGENRSRFSFKKYKEFCGGDAGQKVFRDSVAEEAADGNDLEHNATFDYGWSFHSPNFAIDPAASYTTPAKGQASLML